MTKEELAKKCEEYLKGEGSLGFPDDCPLFQEAAENQLVIAYVWEDEKMDAFLTLKGVLDDEVSVMTDSAFPVTYYGFLKNECGDDNCPYFDQKGKETPKLFVYNDGVCDTPNFGVGQKRIQDWDNLPDSEKFAWVVQADFSAAEFKIYEEEIPVCKGIIFHW